MTAALADLTGASPLACHAYNLWLASTQLRRGTVPHLRPDTCAGFLRTAAIDRRFPEPIARRARQTLVDVGGMGMLYVMPAEAT